MEVSTALARLAEGTTLTLHSTRQLAAEVLQNASKLDKDREDKGQEPFQRKHELEPVAQLERSAGVPTTPWRVLHALARATVLSRNSSSRALAQHWGALRYVTALQRNEQRRVELSADGDDPKYHHKAVQAKDLGIAFGVVAAEHAVQRRHPDYRWDVVDAELVLEPGWVLRGKEGKLKERGKVLPNYVLVGRKRGAPVRIVVVDCRGSHGAARAQHDQLARSSQRVQRIVLGNVDNGGGPPPSLITTTAIKGTGGVETRVLDPDGDGVLAVPGKEAPDLSGPVQEGHLDPFVPCVNSDGERSSYTGFPIPEDDWEWFSRVLVRSTSAGLLSFAGDRSSARELLTERQQERLGSAGRGSSGMECDIRIVLGGMEFVGTDHVFRFDQQRTEVFSAIPRRLYDPVKAGEFDRYETALVEVLQEWERASGRVAEEWGGLVHLDSAGTLLAVRAQGAGKALP